jgi:hypothetical protein
LDDIATELNALMRQFKIERSELRFDISLPVRLTGTDVSGQPLDQEVFTVNISPNGALLKGVEGKLRIGNQISLARGQRHDQFAVAWVGKKNTHEAGEIGISAVAAASSFWNDVLPSQREDEPGKKKYSSKIQAKPKARAQGA